MSSVTGFRQAIEGASQMADSQILCSIAGFQAASGIMTRWKTRGGTF
ncbi:hypothetical protein B4096_0699 [Heyndrickxia coagulans]|nr:hypothetical protein B4096_0699 [Heyndrickxia coagulans]